MRTACILVSLAIAMGFAWHCCHSASDCRLLPLAAMAIASAGLVLADTGSQEPGVRMSPTAECLDTVKSEVKR